ncbi:hypothetical protein [Thioalkalivibrio sp. ALE19]|uniref:hypothetical protein n=1 Tax=Thioalkalivibrio sp. ALE19 TaxID=1266909 RepID=UPI00048C7B01|nr:hypothetical protein [Thioalkalivibrio sp. ALE19]
MAMHSTNGNEAPARYRKKLDRRLWCHFDFFPDGKLRTTWHPEEPTPELFRRIADRYVKARNAVYAKQARRAGCPLAVVTESGGEIIVYPNGRVDEYETLIW